MANHKATIKSTRKIAKRREHNRYYGKTTRNAIKNLLAETEEAVAKEQLPKVISMIDKLAKKNIIHKNKANNIKSRLTKRITAAAQ